VEPVLKDYSIILCASTKTSELKHLYFKNRKIKVPKFEVVSNYRRKNIYNNRLAGSIFRGPPKVFKIIISLRVQSLNAKPVLFYGVASLGAGF
jgi:hypothetical protein